MNLAAIETSPLISCLCVTKSKPEFLARAIKCFESQRYPNKELVIIYENDNHLTREMLRSINNKAIRAEEIPCIPKKALGELRNIGVSCCNGDYVCQWDDDDWCHDGRLEMQMRAIRESCKPASILMSWIAFNDVTFKAYISPTRAWEGSILFKKELVSDDLRYGMVNKGEDTMMIQKMIARNYIYPLMAPELYIYVFHGKNTFGEEHFRKIFEHSQRLADCSAVLIREILEERIDNSTASRLLSNGSMLKEIDYFFSIKRMNIF